MSTTFMGRWHERNLKRVEKRMEKVRARLEGLQQQKDEHSLTPAKFTRKKSALDNKLRRLSARERTLRGAIMQERQKASRTKGATAR